jgi:hypothetical protein
MPSHHAVPPTQQILSCLGRYPGPTVCLGHVQDSDWYLLSISDQGTVNVQSYGVVCLHVNLHEAACCLQRLSSHAVITITRSLVNITWDDYSCTWGDYNDASRPSCSGWCPRSMSASFLDFSHPVTV